MTTIHHFLEQSSQIKNDFVLKQEVINRSWKNIQSSTPTLSEEQYHRICSVERLETIVRHYDCLDEFFLSFIQELIASSKELLHLLLHAKKSIAEDYKDTLERSPQDQFHHHFARKIKGKNNKGVWLVLEQYQPGFSNTLAAAFRLAPPPLFLACISKLRHVLVHQRQYPEKYLMSSLQNEENKAILLRYLTLPSIEHPFLFTSYAMTLQYIEDIECLIQSIGNCLEHSQ